MNHPVYDVTNRDSFDAVLWWFSERNQDAPERAVKMIVGNKSDKVASSLANISNTIVTDMSTAYSPTCDKSPKPKAQLSLLKTNVSLSSRLPKPPRVCARHSARCSKKLSNCQNLPLHISRASTHQVTWQTFSWSKGGGDGDLHGVNTIHIHMLLIRTFLKLY